MHSALLQSIIERIDELTVEEQRQLRDVLELQLKPALVSEEEFEEVLVKKGVLSRPKRRSGPPPQRAPLIEVEGEPLSEQIIRERR